MTQPHSIGYFSHRKSETTRSITQNVLFTHKHYTIQFNKNKYGVYFYNHLTMSSGSSNGNKKWVSSSPNWKQQQRRPTTTINIKNNLNWFICMCAHCIQKLIEKNKRTTTTHTNTSLLVECNCKKRNVKSFFSVFNELQSVYFFKSLKYFSYFFGVLYVWVCLFNFIFEPIFIVVALVFSSYLLLSECSVVFTFLWFHFIPIASLLLGQNILFSVFLCLFSISMVRTFPFFMLSICNENCLTVSLFTWIFFHNFIRASYKKIHDNGFNVVFFIHCTLICVLFIFIVYTQFTICMIYTKHRIFILTFQPVQSISWNVFEIEKKWKKLSSQQPHNNTQYTRID